MYKAKDPCLSTIEDVVSANTGMTQEELLNDHAQYRIDGLREAAIMIIKAIRNKKKIYICGDYDVDGVMGTAILELGLRYRHADTVVRLPRRFSEGYGIKENIVNEFEDGQFLITVDNGIASFDAVRLAKKKGMEVLIVDHHLADVDPVTGEPIYPEADLIIDPNAIPGSADFNGYCGAGLAYRLIYRMVGSGSPLIPKIKSMAAIATIADSVPLVWENRRIVKGGLSSLVTRGGTTKGLYALLCALELDKYVSEGNIGYRLGPIINACGRLADDGAMKAYSLMVFEGPFKEAIKMANELILINDSRKALTDKWIEKASAVIDGEGYQDDFPITMYLPEIPEGIIGIIAGRIAEKYKTPCVMLGDSSTPGVLKGSARSYGNVHLKNLFDENRDCFITYGGHAAAAGLSIKKEDVDKLRTSLIRSLEGAKDQSDEQQDLFYYDIRIHPDQVKETVNKVMEYGPYGEGCPSPRILIEDLTLMPQGKSYYRILSNGTGVKLMSPDMEAVSFDGAKEYEKLNNPRHVDLIGTLTLNYFRGNFKPQMEYKHVFPHQITAKRSALAMALEKRASGRYAQN